MIKNSNKFAHSTHVRLIEQANALGLLDDDYTPRIAEMEYLESIITSIFLVFILIFASLLLQSAQWPIGVLGTGVGIYLMVKKITEHAITLEKVNGLLQQTFTFQREYFDTALKTKSTQV